MLHCWSYAFCLRTITHCFYPGTRGLFAVRSHAERLSNGDENEIRIDIENFYSFKVNVEVIDEIPHQFQRRDLHFT